MQLCGQILAADAAVCLRQEFLDTQEQIFFLVAWQRELLQGVLSGIKQNRTNPGNQTGNKGQQAGTAFCGFPDDGSEYLFKFGNGGVWRACRYKIPILLLRRIPGLACFPNQVVNRVFR